jgi:hypothetical protein
MKHDPFGFLALAQRDEVRSGSALPNSAAWD